MLAALAIDGSLLPDTVADSVGEHNERVHVLLNRWDQASTLGDVDAMSVSLDALDEQSRQRTEQMLTILRDAIVLADAGLDVTCDAIEHLDQQKVAAVKARGDAVAKTLKALGTIGCDEQSGMGGMLGAAQPAVLHHEQAKRQIEFASQHSPISMAATRAISLVDSHLEEARAVGSKLRAAETALRERLGDLVDVHRI